MSQRLNRRAYRVSQNEPVAPAEKGNTTRSPFDVLRVVLLGVLVAAIIWLVFVVLVSRTAFRGALFGAGFLLVLLFGSMSVSMGSGAHRASLGASPTPRRAYILAGIAIALSLVEIVVSLAAGMMILALDALQF